MSTGLELIPFAIAGIAAIIGRKKAMDLEAEMYSDFDIVLITRMRDLDLARDALAATGATAVPEAGGGFSARLGGEDVLLRLGEDGVIGVHVREAAEAAVAAAVEELDKVYGGLVQQRCHANLVARAQAQGYAVESERVEADGTVVLTLGVAS